MRAVILLAVVAAAFADPKFYPAQKQFAIQDEFIVTLKAPSPKDVQFNTGLRQFEEQLIARNAINLLERRQQERVQVTLARPAEKIFLVTLDKDQLQIYQRSQYLISIEQDAYVVQAGISKEQLKAPWGLDRIDQQTFEFDNKFEYDSTAGKGVNVYVLDTGIFPDHKEFAGRAFMAEDFLSLDRSIMDTNGHGTHVAGIIGGTQFGVAKKASLLGVRVLDQFGKGRVSDIVSAIEWVARFHYAPAVASLPFVGFSRSPIMEFALQRLFNAGVLPIIAAGNERVDACDVSPANSKFGVTVGSIDQQNQRSSFSNFGACLRLFAPGEKITSALFVQPESKSIVAQSRYLSATSTISGTSMAQAFVAGVAAQRLALYPQSTPTQLRNFLIQNAHQGTKAAPVVLARGPDSPDAVLFASRAVLNQPLAQ